MSGSSSLAPKLVLALGSLAVFGAAGAWLLDELGHQAPSVETIDDTAEFGSLLEERRRARQGTPPGEAPGQVPGQPPMSPAPGKGRDSGSEAPRKIRSLDLPPPEDLARAKAPVPGPSDTWPPRLVREPLPEDMAHNIFAMLRQDQNIYDPLAYYLREPNYSRRRRFEEHPNRRYMCQTNGASFFNDEEVGPKEGVRIIVTGDSHIEGVCANHEAAPQLLAGLLREALAPRGVEAFNAGVGGYQPYNYLGSLERNLEYEPDVFVMIVYGGNDFGGMLRLERYFTGRGPMSLEPFAPRALGLIRHRPEIKGQEIGQVLYFMNNPGDVQVACDTLASITREAHELAREAGVKLLSAYLPPVLAGQPELNAEWRADVSSVLGILESDLDVSSRIADCWIAWMEREGLPHVDLRPIFAADPESLYWESDQHINLLGQQRVAEGLAPAVQALLE